MKNNVIVRELEEKDINPAAELLIRLKKLNGEFDSIFNVYDQASDDARKHLENMISGDGNHVAFIAEKGGKLIGILTMNVLHRQYYLPEREARIVDFYIMPEARRSGAGKMLIDRAYKYLRSEKIKLITAEFPSLNPIALSFYKRLGYREIVGVYGKIIDDEQP